MLLMVHGNPTGCFIYRHLIARLRGQFRCVAIDLPGFGLSRCAGDANFRPQDHAHTVLALMRALNLNDTTLIAHDWGGPFGLAAGFAEPGRISRAQAPGRGRLSRLIEPRYPARR